MRVDWTAIGRHIKKHKSPYILLGLFVLFNLSVLIDLVADWMRDDNYSHGFFIIPLSVFLFYRQRNEISLPAKPSGAGLVILIFGCLGLIFGIAASEFFTTRVSFVLVLTGLTLYYLGRENFKKVWFPFAFLLFMIPIPSIIYFAATAPMQLFGSYITNDFLQFIGVPSYREGNIIYLPQYALEVTEACSGLRSLVTLMSLGAFYAYLFVPGRTAPTIVFLMTIPIAIITNILRLMFTGVGAYAISIEIAEEFLHELSGMVVFMAAMILLMITGAVARWIAERS